MIHGSEDSLITGGMYDEIFAALQNLGKEAVYVEYKGEGHTPGTYSFSHQLDLTNRIVAWFDKYLKGQAN